MRWLALALMLWCPIAADAQIVKQLTIIPARFQNEPVPNWTPAQILAMLAESNDPSSTTLGTALKLGTNGQYTLDVRVLNYVTLPYNKRPAPAGCTQPGPQEGTLQAASWNGPGVQAAQSSGQTIVGRAWVIIPSLLGQCSHLDQPGIAVHEDFRHGSGFWQYYFWYEMGLPLSIAWNCHDFGGAYVTYSLDCTNEGAQRNTKTITGQGDGLFSAPERMQLGTLPESRVKTFPAGGSAQTFTLTFLEVSPGSGAFQAVRIPAGPMSFGQPLQILLEAHAATQFGGWEANGLFATADGITRLLDFTPDGKLMWPYTAHLAVGQSMTFQNGLRVKVNSGSATGLSLTVDYTTPPTGPPVQECASPDGTRSATIIDGACHQWTVGPVDSWLSSTGYQTMRDGTHVGGGGGLLEMSDPNSYCFAVGQVYIHYPGTQWLRWQNGFVDYGPNPPSVCGGSGPPQPPPDPPVTPNCTRASTVTDTSGAVWTLGPLGSYGSSTGPKTYRNNQHAGGGLALQSDPDPYLLADDVVWVHGTDSQWYPWNAGWGTPSSGVPACGVAPPPPQPPSPNCTRAATIRDGSGAVWTLGPTGSYGGVSGPKTYLNDSWAAGGLALASDPTPYFLVNGTAHVHGTDLQWYRWGGSWALIGAQPSCP